MFLCLLVRDVEQLYEIDGKYGTDLSDQVRDVHILFSSRRRHTRCSRDWSSDVCSSDLCGLMVKRVLTNYGDGQESRIAAAIEDLLAGAPDRRPHVLNLSFSGYTLDDANCLRNEIGRASCRERV